MLNYRILSLSLATLLALIYLRFALTRKAAPLTFWVGIGFLALAITIALDQG